ncbi:hypothetical protein VC83_07593 [Pseudogymnoascus destructans]|uniref:Uncharacterized protein n=1 Tax=Pseudogymnoascus destructans TaxID=655981 RepID=A0A177A339_9PEZI|nr:uncharacterized protein VC83_07593 [Pseudogymnoascus destructans]OAF55503.1 hypothetical protein VC83_07593 [Pseudogymnoascus destructans]
MEPTPDQTLVSQAISDIFLPFFDPDVLLKGYSQESAQLLTRKISPIFWQVTQSLSVPECVILISARQAFTDSNIANWGLHLFAMSKDRNQQVEQKMAYRYSVRAREYLDVAAYDSRFDKLKQKLEEQIERLASDKNCTFKVFKAFRGLIFEVTTDDDLTSYLTNETWSLCFACIEEDDFTRPLLQAWFISEGAQQ